MMEKNKKFKEFCAAQEADPRSKGYKLPTYQVLPVQRIPRYELLLQQVLKLTEDDDPEKDQLVLALDKVKKVCNVVNLAKATSSQKQRLITIQEGTQVTDQKTQILIIPSRRVLFESPSNLVELDTNRHVTQSNSVQIFLFNDSLFYQVTRQGKMNFGELFPFHLNCTFSTLTTTLDKKEMTGVTVTVRVPKDFDPIHPGDESAYKKILGMSEEDERTKSKEITRSFVFSDKSTTVELLNNLSTATEEMKKARQTFIGQDTSNSATTAAEVKHFDLSDLEGSGDGPVPSPSSTPFSSKQETSTGTGAAKVFAAVKQSVRTNSIDSGRALVSTKEDQIKLMINDETEYVNQLQSISDDYIKPLQRRPKGLSGLAHSTLAQACKLTNADVSKLFGEIETIVKMHTLFLQSLNGEEELPKKKDKEKSKDKDKNAEKSTKTTSSKDIKIGEVFEKLADMFNIYKLYSPKKDERQAKLNQYSEQSDSFRKFLKESHDNSATGMSLEELLALPVDRLPIYKIQISKVIDLTPENDPERESLIRAMDKISNVITAVNQSMETSERRHNLLTLQSHIRDAELRDNLITATRLLLTTETAFHSAVAIDEADPKCEGGQFSLFKHFAQQEGKNLLANVKTGSLSELLTTLTPSLSDALNPTQRRAVVEFWSVRSNALKTAEEKGTRIEAMLYLMNDALLIEHTNQSDDQKGSLELLITFANLANVSFSVVSTSAGGDEESQKFLFRLAFLGSMLQDKTKPGAPNVYKVGEGNQMVLMTFEFNNKTDWEHFRNIFCESVESLKR
ncbi:putative RhoGEF domain containing protein [Blattamonas nauphoetae]|uniref:RhoGEF domain containing protein n=1 Tax=Blattamonas nauphoetae TaxID=2049346 RepID=A0ABQ9X8M3_9EUKA|nr:putative RhoGEF domain containing protein [Blattamonas nauphoetae]